MVIETQQRQSRDMDFLAFVRLALATHVPRLTANDFARLPQAVVNSGDSLADCTVCLECMVTGTLAVQLPCGHRFCVECAREWLTQHRTCPNCRQEVACRDSVSPLIFALDQMTQATPAQTDRLISVSRVSEAVMHDVTPVNDDDDVASAPAAVASLPVAAEGAVSGGEAHVSRHLADLPRLHRATSTTVVGLGSRVPSRLLRRRRCPPF